LSQERWGQKPGVEGCLLDHSEPRDDTESLVSGIKQDNMRLESLGEKLDSVRSILEQVDQLAKSRVKDTSICTTSSTTSDKLKSAQKNAESVLSAVKRSANGIQELREQLATSPSFLLRTSQSMISIPDPQPSFKIPTPPTLSSATSLKNINPRVRDDTESLVSGIKQDNMRLESLSEK